MDRRKSIKSIILGGVAGGLALQGCKSDETGTELAKEVEGFKYNYARTPEEKELIVELESEQFLTQHELATVTVLCGLILPANETAGSAVDAGVPHFIEFMAKDIPEMQTPLRGGLMWLDHKCNTDFGIEFKSASKEQQKQLLDPIAFYDPEIPLSQQPLEIQFFTMMRNLTLTGYYTSKMGIEDLGYKGNTPNVWDGVPEDVLEQHGVAYDPEWLAKCVDQSQRNVIAEWDANGKLLT
jgi:hypothetical protein